MGDGVGAAPHPEACPGVLVLPDSRPHKGGICMVRRANSAASPTADDRWIGGWDGNWSRISQFEHGYIEGKWGQGLDVIINQPLSGADNCRGGNCTARHTPAGQATAHILGCTPGCRQGRRRDTARSAAHFKSISVLECTCSLCYNIY
jgi:hypothetical protein